MGVLTVILELNSNFTPRSVDTKELYNTAKNEN